MYCSLLCGSSRAVRQKSRQKKMLTHLSFFKGTKVRRNILLYILRSNWRVAISGSHNNICKIKDNYYDCYYGGNESPHVDRNTSAVCQPPRNEPAPTRTVHPLLKGQNDYYIIKFNNILESIHTNGDSTIAKGPSGQVTFAVQGKLAPSSPLCVHDNRTDLVNML